MPIIKFPFRLYKPFTPLPLFDVTEEAGNGGITMVRNNTPSQYGGYAVRVRTRLPNPSNTVDDWYDFLENTEGGTQVFGFKEPLRARYYVSTDEALGTAAPSQNDFPLDFKYVDESTLVVKKDAVVQGSGWFIDENEIAPIVRFDPALSGGEVVTASYEYYVPCRLRGVAGENFLGGGVNFDTLEFEVYEYFAGARYV